MGIVDKILKTVNIWLDEENDNYEKGLTFEKYVFDLFNPTYYSIEEWTRDVSDKRAGRTVESDKNPDLLIRYKPKAERFAVECKFRSNYVSSQKINKNVIAWSYPEQIQRYQEFSKKKGIPVFVVIGMKGSPDNPEYMYCIPLEEASYPEIFPSVFGKYRRQPGKPFFWSNGILK
jgi:hypothetical protein